MIEGMNRFQNARLHAFWEEVVALMRGRAVGLMSFEDIRNRLRLSEESYKGLREIEIEKIAGSVGRYRDFTANFLPRSGKMQERWSRVYAKANSLEGLPPIEVYQVGDVYFVRDGNHRVSVARQLKMKVMEAHVTELRTPISLHARISASELDGATAYAQFLAESGLRVTRPHLQSLQLSEPSRYGEMMEYIYHHQSFLSHIEGHEVSLRDAAAHWYDNVYRPAVTLIRKYHVLENHPQPQESRPRTEADLFMWMVDHLHELREQLGDSAPTSYTDALAQFMSATAIPVPDALFAEQDSAALLTQTQLMRAVAGSNAPSSGEPYLTRHSA